MKQSLSRGKENKKRETVSVVIITYNNGKEIGNCLSSLNRQVFSKATSLSKILVIDNNSTDETVEIVKRYQKKGGRNKLILKINHSNFGFAKAANQGIKKCPCSSWILLLNPDTQFLGKHEIYNLIQCAKKSNAQIAGGLLYKKTGDIQNSFFRTPTLLTAIFEFINVKKIFPNNPFYKKFYYLDEKKYRPRLPKYVQGVSGALMLIKQSVFHKIGFFDEKFFLYLEDVDFCNRARKAGIKIILCPKTKTLHIEGASSKHKKGKINYDAWIKSRKYFFKKNLSLFENLVLQPLFLVDEIAVWLLKKIRKIFELGL